MAGQFPNGCKHRDSSMEKRDKIKQKRDIKRRCVKAEGRGGAERGGIIFDFFKKKRKQQGIQVTLLPQVQTFGGGWLCPRF